MKTIWFIFFLKNTKVISFAKEVPGLNEIDQNDFTFNLIWLIKIRHAYWFSSLLIDLLVAGLLITRLLVNNHVLSLLSVNNNTCVLPMSVTYKTEVEVDGPTSLNNGEGQEIKDYDRVAVIETR